MYHTVNIQKVCKILIQIRITWWHVFWERSNNAFRLALEIVNNAYHLCVGLLQLSGAQCSPEFVVTFYQTMQYRILRLSGYV